MPEPEPTTPDRDLPAAGHVVLTADQRRSRTEPDAVPHALDLLAGVPTHGRFERTAGDEIQGLLRGPADLVPAVEALLRDGRWSIGLGIGSVEHPLPTDPRAGRGDAFLAARDAVTTAKGAPWHLRVVGTGTAVQHLESALWLWAALLGRRTDKGWEVADLLEQGLSHEAVGARLGITQSAVSQRAATAGLEEGWRARDLVAALAEAAVRDSAGAAAANDEGHVGADRQDGPHES